MEVMAMAWYLGAVLPFWKQFPFQKTSSLSIFPQPFIFHYWHWRELLLEGDVMWKWYAWFPPQLTISLAFLSSSLSQFWNVFQTNNGRQERFPYTGNRPFPVRSSKWSLNGFVVVSSHSTISILSPLEILSLLKITGNIWKRLDIWKGILLYCMDLICQVKKAPMHGRKRDRSQDFRFRVLHAIITKCQRKEAISLASIRITNVIISFFKFKYKPLLFCWRCWW